ncbi:hypothetical protein LINPERPRIM_LOCUS16626 [Linum perenne]
MSTPLYQHHGPSASVGAAIGAVAVITVLGVIACVIGRVCYGGRVLGYGGGQYDMESWVETKCSSCVDGRLRAPPPPPPP